VLDLDEDTADKAGELKQTIRKTHKGAGLADAIIFAYSLAENAKILTGDVHLKNMKNAIDLTVQ
jgi:predicted nucleic acid-binding protein